MSFKFEVVPGEPTIVMSQVFAAPREQVFEIFTAAEHVKRWWSWTGKPIAVCEVDLKEGGSYRYVDKHEDGNETAFSGVYKEIDAPARLVYTQVYEEYPDNVSQVTVTFEETGGVTKVTETVVYPSLESRDAVVNYGGEAGAEQSFARIAALLAEA